MINYKYLRFLLYVIIEIIRNEEYIMRIAIIDDNKEDRDSLKEIIKKVFFDFGYSIDTINIYEDGQSFLENFVKDKYNFIFLDILMNTLNGIKIAKAIREKDKYSKLIFTSISNDFASESYYVHADGYLLKPIHMNDLSQVMEKFNLSDIYHQRMIHLPTEKTLFIHSILYTSFYGHYVTIHCKNQKQIKIRCTQKEIVQCFSLYSDFVTCTKGMIVNLNYVSQLNDDHFTMINGDMIPISRRNYQNVKQLYSDFWIDKIRKGHI